MKRAKRTTGAKSTKQKEQKERNDNEKEKERKRGLNILGRLE
jgi:hypothetical protein